MSLSDEYGQYANECNCERCRKMCTASRPCWGEPWELLRIIEQGHADKLMLDYWGEMVPCENEDDATYHEIAILSPAVITPGYSSLALFESHAGGRAPFWPIGRCIFHENDRCIIHDIKPIEGRVSIHKEYESEDRRSIGSELHEKIVKTWDTEEGVRVVNIWKEKVGWDR